ncbi:MAG: hypothetical protein ACWGQW_08740 [bacterium]
MSSLGPRIACWKPWLISLTNLILILIPIDRACQLHSSQGNETYRTIVARLITGYRATLEEEQLLQFGENLVFRISLYRASGEGDLLPHQVRSMANLEIHLEDAYPERTKALFPTGKVEINGHELFVMFARNAKFFEDLERIVLVVTDQNNLAATFRQTFHFDARNLLGQLRPTNRAGKTGTERTITPCALLDGTNLTIQGLVQCHRISVGSDQVLGETEYRLAEGVTRATGQIFREKGHRSGMVEGQSSFYSDHHSTTLKLEFESDYYPADGFSFDGEDVLKPASGGNHFSYLAELLESCEEYVSARLVGGVLSTFWPLLDLQSSRQRFELIGLEKTDGVEYLTVRCRLSRDATAKLYFDPRTMQHLMTKYSGKTLFGSKLGLGRSISLEERFSEFREFDGLYLPTRWLMTLGLPQETIQLEIDITQVFHENISMLKH